MFCPENFDRLLSCDRERGLIKLQSGLELFSSHDFSETYTAIYTQHLNVFETVIHRGTDSI